MDAAFGAVPVPGFSDRACHRAALSAAVYRHGTGVVDRPLVAAAFGAGADKRLARAAGDIAAFRAFPSVHN